MASRSMELEMTPARVPPSARSPATLCPKQQSKVGMVMEGDSHHATYLNVDCIIVPGLTMLPGFHHSLAVKSVGSQAEFALP